MAYLWTGLLLAVLPAAIGNIIGPFFLMAVPFYLAGHRARSEAQLA